jgi:hypothetical protein
LILDFNRFVLGRVFKMALKILKPTSHTPRGVLNRSAPVQPAFSPEGTAPLILLNASIPSSPIQPAFSLLAEFSPERGGSILAQR